MAPLGYRRLGVVAASVLHIRDRHAPFCSVPTGCSVVDLQKLEPAKDAGDGGSDGSKAQLDVLKRAKRTETAVLTMSGFQILEHSRMLDTSGEAPEAGSPLL